MRKKLQADMIGAMKSGNKVMLDAIRMIVSDVKKEEIDTGKELADGDVIRIIKKGIKSREEAIKLYRQGNRPELAAKEEQEIAVLAGYVPAQLPDAEVEKIVSDAIAALGIVSKKDTGRLMKEIMGTYGSRIDGKKVQEFAQKKLV